MPLGDNKVCDSVLPRAMLSEENPDASESVLRIGTGAALGLGIGAVVVLYLFDGSGLFAYLGVAAFGVAFGALSYRYGKRFWKVVVNGLDSLLWW